MPPGHRSPFKVWLFCFMFSEVQTDKPRAEGNIPCGTVPAEKGWGNVRRRNCPDGRCPGGRGPGGIVTACRAYIPQTLNVLRLVDLNLLSPLIRPLIIE